MRNLEAILTAARDALYPAVYDEEDGLPPGALPRFEAAMAVIGAGEQTVAQHRLALAKQALVETGYFTEAEVGPDIAPRITELWNAIVAGDTAAAVPTAVVAEPGSRLLIFTARNDVPVETLDRLKELVAGRFPDHKVSIMAGVSTVVVAPPNTDEEKP